jgi:hypothetical protein
LFPQTDEWLALKNSKILFLVSPTVIAVQLIYNAVD